MRKKLQTISRRDFLKGAAAGAVSVAAAGLLGGFAMGEEGPEAGEEPVPGAPGGPPMMDPKHSGETAAVYGSSWKDAPAPVDDAQISQEYDVDVVVIGHGYAGLNACRYLAEQGVSVTLIESQAEDKYNAMGNEGAAPNATVLKERGVPEIDPVEYYNNWMLNSGYQANPGLMMKFCQNSGENMDAYLSVLTEDELSNMTTAFYPPTEHQLSQIGPFKF